MGFSGVHWIFQLYFYAINIYFFYKRITCGYHSLGKMAQSRLLPNYTLSWSTSKAPHGLQMNLVIGFVSDPTTEYQKDKGGNLVVLSPGIEPLMPALPAESPKWSPPKLLWYFSWQSVYFMQYLKKDWPTASARPRACTAKKVLWKKNFFKKLFLRLFQMHALSPNVPAYTIGSLCLRMYKCYQLPIEVDMLPTIVASLTCTRL